MVQRRVFLLFYYKFIFNFFSFLVLNVTLLFYPSDVNQVASVAAFRLK